jgi:hypothetical protein
MLESFKDLKLDKDIETVEKLVECILSQVDLKLEDCYEVLTASLKQRAEELLVDIENIAPYGDYSSLIENPNQFLPFLQNEAAKPENWELSFIDTIKGNDKLLEFIFVNKALDDGDLLKGFVFVSPNGKVRHAFCQIHT